MSTAAQPTPAPDPAPDEGDDIETARLRAAVAEARANPGSVPHERVREWLLALAEGRRAAPPRP